MRWCGNGEPPPDLVAAAMADGVASQVKVKITWAIDIPRGVEAPAFYAAMARIARESESSGGLQ